jgi:polynucleotide 5'-hydroxyl-kinase GRC3/NOL9
LDTYTKGGRRIQQTVQPNRTLLVDGPASVQLVTGKAEVFANPLKETQRVVVREGKRMPFYVSEAAVFSVLLGANAAVSEVEGNTVPESWNKPIQTVLGLQKKPVVILVLGAADSGKSSFSTYLLNRLTGEQRRVAVLDGDLGQSDIGPSASVGYAIASKSICELYNLRLQNGYFVGVTSPVLAVKNTLQGLSCMMSEACKREADYVLVNTDGFVLGDDAIRYKLDIIKELKPDVVVAVQLQGELDPLLSYLGGGGVMTVQPSTSLNLRTPETRKTLREMTYAKYLKKSKLQCLPLSQITVEPRNGVPKTQEPEKGVLVGLYGCGSKFLGIGVLRAINTERRTLKVQTSVTTKPMRLVFGKVFLNEKLQEVEDQV